METSLRLAPGTVPVAKNGLTRKVGLRVWLWLLTPGFLDQTPAARLRGWARALDWHEREGGRRGLLRRAALRPILAWKEAGNAVEQHGGEVEEVSGVPRARQHRQLWWLAVRHGLNAHSYRAYRLYLPERRRMAGRYAQEREFYRVMRWYNRQHADSDYRTMMDKELFQAWCAVNGLPHVPTLVTYDHGELVFARVDGDPVASLPAADLFQKPADGTGGHGTERWSYVGSPREHLWRARDGRTLPASSLLAEMADLSASLPEKFGRLSRRMLLQPCLRNHADLLPLTPGALCTLRVVTVREPGGRAQAILAAYKMARAGAVGDNTDLGGISAPMDLTTGVLGPGVGPRGAVRVTYEHHPDTGAEIAGREVPFWREAVALAIRGLDASNRLPSLGWDIAITDEGPVLLEGNPASNPGIAQAPTGVPLSDTPLPRAIDAHMRQLFGLA
ncbi:MAG TPA: sugar-transfer associated ATP-grasp domain-containing protein [Gemmatimonadales bacterium]